MRVLIVKLGAIGDVIMSLTMIPALRAANPDAHLTWVVGRGIAPLLELIDGIDTVLAVDDQQLLCGGVLGRTRSILSVWGALGARHFELVVTAHGDWRYRLLTVPVLAQERRYFRAVGRSGPIRGRYHGGEYARLITGQDGPAAPRYDLPRITRPLPVAPFARRPEERIVVLAPGGARNLLRDDALRRWPVEHYALLAHALTQRGFQVVLVGAGHDSQFRPAFDGLPVTDLIGKTSLPELAATFRAANIIVTHDSGALHLARLMRTPVVALFGPTSPLERIPSPECPQPGSHPQALVIWGGAHLPCRPCYDGVHYAACPMNECLRSVSPDQVLCQVDRLLGCRRE